MNGQVLPPTRWGDRKLCLGHEEPFVMAILNATPDSFSGDGLLEQPRDAGDLAEAAVAAGADLIDIGAESTRPGHQPVDSAAEIERLLPVLKAVVCRVVSSGLRRYVQSGRGCAALDAGASIVNDVRGLQADPELAQLAAKRGVPVVVMHDIAPDGHGDLLTSIVRELSRRLDRALALGIPWEMLIVDPGFGFGKDWRQNLELLHRLRELAFSGGRSSLNVAQEHNRPGVGAARARQVEGTAATVALAIAGGADIVRVHDVREMARVARMTDAVVRSAPEREQRGDRQTTGRLAP